MKVKILHGTVTEVEKEFNEWVKDIPIPDIYQIETLAFPAPMEGLRDLIAIVVYIRC